ncbi:MAG TPA: AAA family ATPase [Noviherbaspirillum sp.]|jgi:type II secretory pathway predicted ATPase ExeA|uniref:ExeA family protein n=1 Tax=Noviherbaspirillum sp. TaxID=1926288 RepID=UPI002DDD9859|nr:AAA family ATPase [Noviherbaspirillum sp.]HEV2611022.1 AAA family ATPase [Noviherbaspirillum sp.]
MYLSHFGLNQSPFGITPNPAFFYAGSKRGEILEALIYAVCHGEGIVKVTGEVGSGKTMLCRMLESLLPANVDVIYLVNPTLARDEVVYAIASELGIATSGLRPDEVIRLLQSDLITRHGAGRQVVLLVEEAQAMPLETLEEIRLFSNLETAHHKLLQIVLFGQPELEDSLNLPSMRQLKERITHSFKVPPLPLDVIPEFLMFRMRAAGYRGPDVFSKGAVQLIASVSEGIVRRISILADKSLLAAFSDNSHAILPQHVKAAIQDSEFSNTASRKWRRNAALGAAMFAGLVAAATAGWSLRPVAAPAPVASASVPVPSVSAAPAATASSAPSPATPPVTAVAQDEAPVSAPAAPAPPPLASNPSASAPPATPAPPAPLAPSAASLLQQRLAATRALLGKDGQDRMYTVQIALMATDSPAQVERFLRKAEGKLGADRLFVYPTRIGEETRYGVAYDSLASRSQTMDAIASLSKEFGYRPQLRTFGGIRAEIERSKAESLWDR